MSVDSSEVFPYLVIMVGVENILVITKSVVSTPVDLDVKIRVAQGIVLNTFHFNSLQVISQGNTGGVAVRPKFDSLTRCHLQVISQLSEQVV